MKSFLGCALAASLVFAAPLRADDNAHYLDNGYSLLHHLCEQESQVELILVIKTTPKDVADFARQVSKNAKDDLDLLGRMQDHDSALRFDRNGLPQVELDTRAAIKDDKQHTLLFGTKNAAFARALLVAQIEAGTYGMNLAKMLADHESSDHRAAIDRKISAGWQKLRDKAYRLLGDY